MGRVSIDVAPGVHDFLIRIVDCEDSVQKYVASMVSSRWLPKTAAFAAHLNEFRGFREYLDSIKDIERDASEEVMDRILQWNRAADLAFRIKTGEFNLGIRPEYLSGMKTKLYKDQVTGVRWLAARPRSCLADSMGIGKTIQALSTFSVWRALGVAERGLVISISGVKPGWVKEVGKHSSFTVTALPNGTKAILSALETYRKNPTDLLVIHYEGICQLSKSSVILDPETGNSEVIQALLKFPFDVVFVDEAHLLKNMDTRRYQSYAYLINHLNTSLSQVVVQYQLESGEMVERLMTENAARQLTVGDEVDIL